MNTLARLFVGLWPDEHVRAAVWAHAQRWQWPRGARRVPREKLHMTVHFLGGVPRERLPELATALRVVMEPFVLTLRRGAVWPNQVAVIEPMDVPPQLLALHQDLRLALVGLGITPSHDRLVPHVTLARHARGASAPEEGTAIEWRVNGYMLIESVPGAGYKPLVEYD